MNLGIPVLIPVAEPDAGRVRRALARLHEIQPLSCELRSAEAAVTLVPCGDHRPADLTVVAAEDEMSLAALANAPGPAQEAPAAIWTPATLIATADRAVLRLDVSHLVADAWSVRCLAEQFQRSYCGKQLAMADVDAFCEYLAERHARIAAAAGTPRYERLAGLPAEAGSPYGYVQLDPLVPMSRRLDGAAVRLRRQVDGATFRSQVRAAGGSPLACLLGRVAYYCAALGPRERAMFTSTSPIGKIAGQTTSASGWPARPCCYCPDANWRRWRTASKEPGSMSTGASRKAIRWRRRCTLTALREGIDGFRHPSVWVTYGKVHAADPKPAAAGGGGFGLAAEGVPVSYGRGWIDIDVTDRGDVVDVSLTAEANRFDLPTRPLDLVSDLPSPTTQHPTNAREMP